MKLKALQEQFQRDFNAQKAYKTHFSNHIIPMPKISAQMREGVYFDSITACLARALSEVYPVCKKLVGDDFFTAMAHEYIENHPSKSPNLFDYGDELPKFIANFKPVESLPYLSDVSQLEWACSQAYYAEESTPITAEQLAKVDPGKLLFQLPIGSILMASEYPIDKIWQVNQDGYQGDAVVSLDSGKVRLMVCRQGLDVIIQTLSKDLWLFLQAINTEKPFNVICEQLANEIDIFIVLPLAIQKNLLCRKTGFVC